MSLLSRSGPTQQPPGGRINRSSALARGLVQAWLLNEARPWDALTSTPPSAWTVNGIPSSIASVRGGKGKSFAAASSQRYLAGPLPTSKATRTAAGTGPATIAIIASTGATTASQREAFTVGGSGASPGFYITNPANSTAWQYKASGGANDATITGTTRNADQVYVVVGRSKSSSDHALFVDGIADGTSATNVGNVGVDNYVGIGSRGSTGSNPYNGAIYACFVWKRALSDAEIRALSDNPWQLFESNQRELWVPSAAAGGDGNASGSLPTVTVSAPAGSAIGGALATTALTTCTVTAPAASATGGGAANGALPSVTVSAPSASATGNASATGGLPTVTVSAPTGTASSGGTGGNASGSLPTVTVTAPSASATGGASAPAALPSVNVTPAAATATGGATATSGLVLVSVNTFTATATGGAPAALQTAILYRVKAENRMHRVAGENRLYKVKAENRIWRAR